MKLSESGIKGIVSENREHRIIVDGSLYLSKRHENFAGIADELGIHTDEYGEIRITFCRQTGEDGNGMSPEMTDYSIYVSKNQWSRSKVMKCVLQSFRKYERADRELLSAQCDKTDRERTGEIRQLRKTAKRLKSEFERQLMKYAVGHPQSKVFNPSKPDIANMEVLRFEIDECILDQSV